VRVEPRVARHREDVTGVGIHDDDRATARSVRGDRVGERLLGLVLEVRVDRRHERRARDRHTLDVHAAPDRLPLRAELLRPLARYAREEALEAGLEAGKTLPVDADEAEDLCRERAPRVVT